jgi:hypothetical protein
MRQAGLLVAAFVVTLSVLTGLFFVLGGGPGAPAPTPSPLPTATVSPTIQPTKRPTPAPTATVAPTPELTASPTRAPTAAPATPAPATPAPSAAASSAPQASGNGPLVIVEKGTDYVDSDIPAHGTLTSLPDGSITFTTDRTYAFQAEVQWQLPDGSIPTNRTVSSIDVRICGIGSGDFWESYGPDGSDPVEYEVTSPDPDGCWHYNGAPGDDTTVKAIIRLGSTMTIRTVEYTVKFAN